jgi:hypothetical protein
VIPDCQTRVPEPKGGKGTLVSVRRGTMRGSCTQHSHSGRSSWLPPIQSGSVLGNGEQLRQYLHSEGSPRSLRAVVALNQIAHLDPILSEPTPIYTEAARAAGTLEVFEIVDGVPELNDSALAVVCPCFSLVFPGESLYTNVVLRLIVALP